MDAYPKAAMERAMRVQDVEVADAEEDRFGPICVFPFANISNALPKCQPLPVVAKPRRMRSDFAQWPSGFIL